MDELPGILLFGFIAIMVIGFILWVLLAIFMRILALLVVYWIVTFLIGLLAGVVGGLVVPIRVLRGHAQVKPVIASPDAVVANKVMATKARGAAKNFGWDHGWPLYNPYQAKNDGAAVVAETRLTVSKIWSAISPADWNLGSTGASKSPSAKSASLTNVRRVLTGLPGLAWLTFAAVPVVGAFIGVWVSIAFWLAAMTVVGGAVYLAQQVWVLGYRWFDRLSRKKDRASMRCTKCYRETTMPSYQCPNPNCGVIHRDISPGPLGLRHRRCACGTGFPTTVRAAASKLQAVCPYCQESVAAGSATRRTIQLPTIGAISAGKTRFLAATATSLTNGLADRGGKFTPLNSEAASFLQLSHNLMASGQSTAKTMRTDFPEALPFAIEVGSRKLELHFIDAAGESFQSMDSTQSLGYIDTADVLLFILDPLGLPGIYDEAQRAGLPKRLDIATADQEDAYASAIDRLRAENVNLKQRRLGLVITKLDLLLNLPSGKGITVGDPAGIRQWLVKIGQDGLVRRLEDDFGESIAYFAVDLMHPHTLDNPMHPVHVCEWVLEQSNTRISVVPPAATAGAGAK